MKKLIILLLTVIIYGTSCQEQKNNETFEDSSIQNIDVRSVRQKGDLPYDTNPKLKSLLQNSSEHTWMDLDNYYRTVVLETMTHEDYFMNLQNVVFKRMVTVYNFLDSAPIETIEYYVREQERVKYNAFPILLAMALNKLKGTWSDKKIKDFIQSNLDRTNAYIYSTFDDPEVLIKRSKTDQDYLKNFAITLQLSSEK